MRLTRPAALLGVMLLPVACSAGTGESTSVAKATHAPAVLPSPPNCPPAVVVPGPSLTPEPETPPTGLATTTIPVEGGPMGVAVGFGSVWVAAHRAGTIVRIDPGSNQVAARIPIPDVDFTANKNIDRVFVGPHGVWVELFGTLPQKLYRIDPASNIIALTLSLRGLYGVSDTANGLWVGVDPQNYAPRKAVMQLDPQTGRVLRTVDLGPPSAKTVSYSGALTYAFGSLWVEIGDNELARVDVSKGTVTATLQIPAAFNGRDVPFAAADTHLFVATFDSGAARIDPTSNCVDGVLYFGHQLPADFGEFSFVSVATAPNILYVAFDRGALGFVDPATLKLLKSVRLDQQDYQAGLAYGFGSVWYPTLGNNSILRITPLP